MVRTGIRIKQEKPMTTAVVSSEPPELTTLSWGAVIAGAVASAALTLLLLAFGVGIGFTVISPWSGEGVSATTFHVGAGLYLIAVAMLASAIGGYLTGRLRLKWPGLHDDEIYFRDTAHGLLTWALATVFSAVLLGSATTHILASATAGSVPATAAASQAKPTDIHVDALLRADTAPAGAAASPGAPAATAPAGDLAATRDELSRLIAPSLRKGGDLSAADRAHAARVVSARTGLNQAEAEKRVSEVVARAKQAADEARKAAAKFMLWIAASMLAGAVAAMLGATEGGLLRDSKWYEPGWRASVVRTH
jgi:hypothetical protein